MNKAKLSLDHQVLFPKKEQEKPPLIILLHGYGSDMNDLFSFAEEINDKSVIVSLQAPISLPWGGRAWYEINYNADATKWTNVPQAIESRDKVLKVISEIHESYGTDPAHTSLLGFSQGSILSYALSLTFPSAVQKVMALSGYLDAQLINLHADSKHIAYFISHGEQDEVIPIDWARKTPVYFDEHQLAYDYHEYMMGHGINPQCFMDLKSWMNKHELL